ncbi:MAG TPA: double-strand break repair helicase AddA, partial [Stellaceae bacterium]|nr:double-strand break repair helicase AddA [Stellaceae bacterium]
LLGRMPDDALRKRARQLFARVLDVPGGMKIQTIHAFCQSLLRRFPLEAGVAPHFELMDERNAADALSEARDEMLTAARRGSDPSLASALALVTRHANEITFDELIASLVQERARFTRALAGGIDVFRARLCPLLGTSEDTTPEAIVAAACARNDSGVAEAARHMLENGSKRDRERGAALAAFLDAADRPARFDAYCGVFFGKDGTERQHLMTRALVAARPDAEAALRREARRLASVLRARAAAALKEATLALATLGDDMLRRYRRHKEAGALLDYEDLVLLARDLLRRPGIAPWVLFKLDGGLDHILIDEAQDTNPEQWEVVAALADEFFAGASARAERRTVFAVGDPKQSIFSFQRADPTAFLRMREHFRARAGAAREGWRTVELDISFRSAPAVLAAIDAVFAQAAARDGVALGDAPDGGARGDAPIRHRPARVGQAGLVELWPPVAPLEPPPSAPWEPPVEQRRMREAQARLAQAIAATIASWIERGERLPARDRRIVAGDVLVLVRRRGAFVIELVRALKAHAVGVAGSDRMRLVEQLAIEDMTALLQFLLLPEDDLTLAAVLKGPLVGFGEERLFELAYPRGRVPLWHELRRRAGEHPDFARAEALLSGLLARADFAPPYELLAEVLGERGGRKAMLGRLGPDAADPLDELMAAALAYERRHGPSLQGFLHWLAAGDIEVKRDFDQRGRSEVRVMTVHGAKGLQAPIVFLPDTLQLPPPTPRFVWTEDGVPLWAAHDGCDAPPCARAREAARVRQGQEYRRLLYVAMTRAEDRLYVCGWNTRQTAPSGNWYELIAGGLAAVPGVERFDFVSPAPGDAGWSGTGLRLVSPQTAPPRSDAALEPDAAPVPLPDWALRPPRPEPVPPRPLAPSRPTAVEPAPRSPLGNDAGASFRRGLIVHRLLQSLPQLPPERRRAAAARFLARPAHGLDAAGQAVILNETLAVLEDPDTAFLFGPESLAEVPVVALVGGRAISGRVDRLVVGADWVAIVDYKTLRPVPADESAVPPLYLEQLRAYRAAMAQVYPGRQVRCGLLWTDGPRLMWISEARLAPAVDALGGGT